MDHHHDHSQACYMSSDGPGCITRPPSLEVMLVPGTLQDPDEQTARIHIPNTEEDKEVC